MLENRIDRITVKNFRSLKEVSVELDDLTVLVGPNGSGKSNFLDVLRLVRDGLTHGLFEAMFRSRASQAAELHFFFDPNKGYDALENIEIEFLLTLKNLRGVFKIELRPTGAGTLGFEAELYQLGSAKFASRDGSVEAEGSNTPRDIPVQKENLSLPLFGGHPAFAPLYDFLAKMQFHLLSSSDFRYVGFGETGEHNLRAESIEKILMEMNSESRAEIADILSSVVPGVSKEDTFVFEPFGAQYFKPKIRHQIGDLPLSQESDGTLRLLSLLAAFYKRPAPSLIAFEEPEVLIHPPATSYLTELMEEASLRGQVIVSTHSPDFIARFPPESLRVFEMVDGATQISPLRADQIETINEQIFNGGDLLRIQGLKRG